MARGLQEFEDARFFRVPWSGLTDFRLCFNNVRGWGWPFVSSSRELKFRLQLQGRILGRAPSFSGQGLMRCRALPFCRPSDVAEVGCGKVDCQDSTFSLIPVRQHAIRMQRTWPNAWLLPSTQLLSISASDWAKRCHSDHAHGCEDWGR